MIFTSLKLETTLCWYYLVMLHSGEYAHFCFMLGLSLLCYAFSIFLSMPYSKYLLLWIVSIIINMKQAYVSSLMLI